MSGCELNLILFELQETGSIVESKQDEIFYQATVWYQVHNVFTTNTRYLVVKGDRDVWMHVAMMTLTFNLACTV